MTDFLIRTFIKRHEKTTDMKVREQFGTLSGTVGILCNVLLFVVKFLIGTLANSVAITSDAFNNLSDSASSIVSLIGYKMAAKPADQDHPFGHGRIEYLSSLIIASAILFVGIEFVRTSIDKILNPTSPIYSHVAVVSLVLSISLKFWMFGFNKKLGNIIHSPAMLATSKDSLSDVLATSTTLIALLFTLVSDFSIDGYAGLIVSFFILKAGFEIIRDTVDTLLGQHADEDTVQSIISIIKAKEGILGVHDLIVHNYGPGKMIASAHVEVRADADIINAHEEIDNIEREVLDQLGIMIVIHMDPVDTNNEMLGVMITMISKILKDLDARLDSHDYRIVPGEINNNVIFDVEVPFDVSLTDVQIKEVIDRKLSEKYPNYHTVITFDRSFI